MNSAFETLRQILPMATFVLAAGATAFMFAWTRRLRSQSLGDEWAAAWADVTKRAREENVPFTAEDSVRDVEDRITRTLALRLRAASRV